MINKMVVFIKYGLKRTQKGELKMVFLTSYGLVKNTAYNSLNISGELTIDIIESVVNLQSSIYNIFG